MDPDWANLPSLALNLTSKLLTLSVDYVRFRSVCSTWRSSAPKLHHLPLLAGHRLDDDDLPFTLNFSIFTGSKIVPVEANHPLLPESDLGGRLCCGSSHGWMAILNPIPRISIYNPITKALILLPTLTDFPDINEGRATHRKVSKIGDDYVVRSGAGFEQREVRTFMQMRRYLANKLVLSSNPSTDPNCVALLIRCRWRRLAICRLGDTSWTPVKFREFRFFHTDALFYKGRFYVVCREALYVLNLGEEPELERIQVANPLFDEDSYLPTIDECYLVESSGDLLVVYVYYRAPFVPTRGYLFEVYKVDWGMHRIKMLKVMNLGDVALFLGRNKSISLPASKFPGIRANCIYMAEYYREEGPEVRVNHMEDMRNEFISNYSTYPTSGWQPCAWITPSILR